MEWTRDGSSNLDETLDLLKAWSKSYRNSGDGEYLVGPTNRPTDQATDQPTLAIRDEKKREK